MLEAIFIYIGGFSVIGIMAYAVWYSSCMIDARKKAWRAGTHDYYGNKIDD